MIAGKVCIVYVKGGIGFKKPHDGESLGDIFTRKCFECVGSESV
jgi:hypothetical protein